jgi:hypothetical protein
MEWLALPFDLVGVASLCDRAQYPFESPSRGEDADVVEADREEVPGEREVYQMWSPPFDAPCRSIILGY